MLNIPTQHLVEEMGEHYFPSRGGWVDFVYIYVCICLRYTNVYHPYAKKQKKIIFSHFFIFLKKTNRLMSMPPEDPTLYRFVEMIKVYGYPLKAIIHEKVRVNSICWYEYWLPKM